ncbi:hypothetical protein CK804_15740, partial [Brucella abortus]
MLICKASSAQGCSPSTTLNQNFMQKGILECRQALERRHIASCPAFRGFSGKITEISIGNRRANALHEILIIGKIVPG